MYGVEVHESQDGMGMCSLSGWRAGDWYRETAWSRRGRNLAELNLNFDWRQGDQKEELK